jgi:hypothetical protein
LASAGQELLRNLIGRLQVFGTALSDLGIPLPSQIAKNRREDNAVPDAYRIVARWNHGFHPKELFVKGAVDTSHGLEHFMVKWDLDVPYDTAPERIQQPTGTLKELILPRKKPILKHAGFTCKASAALP